MTIFYIINLMIIGRKTDQREVSTPFGRNVFIVNHKRQHKFVSIAKGGITTLKHVTAIDDGIKVNDKKQIHSNYPSIPDGKRVVAIGDNKFDKYTKVAIYRDPTSRFLSWYNDKIMHVYQPYLIKLGFLQDNSLERTFEFLNFELGKTEPEWIEEHVRPQSKIYSPKDIDKLVQMSDIDSYVSSIGSTTVKNTNKSKKSLTELPKWAEQELKKLYKDDYQLLDKLKDKLWSSND